MFDSHHQQTVQWRVRSLSGSIEAIDLSVRMLGVLQKDHLCGKYVSKGFVRGSRVNKDGSCNIVKMGDVSREGLGLGSNTGTLINQQGLHALCITLFLASNPITLDSLWRADPSIPSISVLLTCPPFLDY